MKKLLLLLVYTLVTSSFFAPAIAEAARVRVHRGPFHRTTVVVRTGHPIRRPMHAVVIRRPALSVRVAPAIFLPLVVWKPVVIATRPPADVILWQDSETIESDEEWTETLFDCDKRGEKLYLEVVSGRVQFDFAEVVFDNGDCQTVDFNEKTHKAGLYSLLDFKDGRKVDHVRLIAKAKTDEAKIALMLQK